MSIQYWLMKTEPSTFGIEDFLTLPDHTTHWEGIRNYQARNMIRDNIKLGDQVLIYHSNATPSGIVGLGTIVREAYPDHTQYDPESKYYDPKATPEKPIWMMCDVQLVRIYDSIISLHTLKADPQLSDMMVVQKGSRLSIQPVSAEHMQYIVRTYV